MNLPNILTVARILLTCVFLYFMYQDGLVNMIIASSIFAIASITDFLDGYIARKYNLITDFGKIMDPIADKFLILSAFFVFINCKLIAIWMFVLIFVREMGITFLRFKAMSDGRVMAAEGLGKLKTILQIVAIAFMLIFVMLRETVWYESLSGQFIQNWLNFITFIMYIVVVITVYSGYQCIENYRRGRT